MKKLIGLALVILSTLVILLVLGLGSSRVQPTPTPPAQFASHHAVNKPSPTTSKPEVTTADEVQHSSASRSQSGRRLEIAKLRRALEDGDWVAFRDVNGTLEESDAISLHSLFSEIPTSLSGQKQEDFRNRIVQLLQAVPGDSALPLLLDFAKQEYGPRDSISWINAVLTLGYRRYSPASTYVETRAFGLEYKGRSTASEVLLLIDPAQYVGRVAEAMLADPESATYYVSALATVVSGPASLDITIAVPALQQLFNTHYREAKNHRAMITKALIAYSAKFNSDSTRAWVTTQLRAIAESSDRKYAAEEKELCRQLLAQLK